MIVFNSGRQLRKLQSSQDAVVYFLEHESEWLLQEISINHKLYLEKLQSTLSSLMLLDLKQKTLNGKAQALNNFAKECRKSKFSSTAIPFHDLKRLLYCLQTNDLENYYGNLY